MSGIFFCFVFRLLIWCLRQNRYANNHCLYINCGRENLKVAKKPFGKYPNKINPISGLAS